MGKNYFFFLNFIICNIIFLRNICFKTYNNIIHLSLNTYNFYLVHRQFFSCLSKFIFHTVYAFKVKN